MTGASIRNDKSRMHPLPPPLSIIVPIRNEIDLLPELLAHGIWPTIWLMRQLRFTYWRGEALDQLKKFYW